MKQILKTVQKVASVSTPVLIMGESGSGKGLIAEAIHAAVAGQVDSSRPFIAINCPTIPETLLESELFGYRRGAFTGANKDFPGKVRLAEGGTLFLDEIGDFPLSIQAKLLRLLEEKCFEPLGSSTIIKINTRILCATNRDLKAMVAEGLFRKDLFYRINTITIQIPPLRERPEDIIPISEHFLARYAGELGKCIMGLTEAAKMVLREYSWPGNVRELRNVMERAAVLTSSGEIGLSDLPRELQEETALRQPCISRLENIEQEALVNALNCHQWNISAAARELGISRGKLRHRIDKYELTGG
jgi:transcriptional regulator with PAS, ATPase and Fis domain